MEVRWRRGTSAATCSPRSIAVAGRRRRSGNDLEPAAIPASSRGSKRASDRKTTPASSTVMRNRPGYQGVSIHDGVRPCFLLQQLRSHGGRVGDRATQQQTVLSCQSAPGYGPLRARLTERFTRTTRCDGMGADLALRSASIHPDAWVYSPWTSATLRPRATAKLLRGFSDASRTSPATSPACGIAGWSARTRRGRYVYYAARAPRSFSSPSRSWALSGGGGRPVHPSGDERFLKGGHAVGKAVVRTRRWSSLPPDGGARRLPVLPLLRDYRRSR